MCGCSLSHGHAGHHAQHPTESRPTPAAPAAPLVVEGPRCAHCGFALRPEFRFCPGCGMSQGAAECPACGQKVDRSWKSCAYCGSPLRETAGQAF